VSFKTVAQKAHHYQQKDTIQQRFK